MCIDLLPTDDFGNISAMPTFEECERWTVSIATYGGEASNEFGSETQDA